MAPQTADLHVNPADETIHLGPLAVRFAGGTEWDTAALSLLAGYTPPATLDDVLAGTPGDDLLVGGYGNDTYHFGIGSGRDTIQEPFNTTFDELNRATAGTLDVLRFGPGVTPRNHRTDSLDYGVVMSGEIDMELDDGVNVRLKAGDVLVQRGTIHNWINNGTEPCVIAFILIAAKPVTAGSKVLSAHG